MVDFASGRDASSDFFEVLYTQRAIRDWQPRPVPRELLERVIEGASKAPSGSNTQPWVFVVVDDRETLTAIARALRNFADGNELLQATLAGADTAPDKTTRLMLGGARRLFEGLDRAPALIVPCLYELSSPTPDPKSLLAGSSIYMAVQNLLLTARALGLGTVMTTAHAMIEPELRRRLRLPDDAHPVALVPIGYPGANFGPTTRKPRAEILRWNGW
jgi:nitroreductase